MTPEEIKQLKDYYAAIGLSTAAIDQNLKDENGYSFDVGLRSNRAKFLNYDVSVFYLRYNNRIGEIQFRDAFMVLLLRRNIGAAAIRGVEAFAELSVLQLFPQKKEETVLSVFGNVALINSEYLSTQAVGVEGNKLEFVPAVNTKAGLKLAFKNFKFSYQFTYLSDQFSDATNARESGFSAIVGLIPAYAISDISMSYSYQRYKIEASLNNAANRYYFTRRATGYPGPGILPSDGRSIYLSLQVKI